MNATIRSSPQSRYWPFRFWRSHPWIPRALTILFFLLVAALLVRQAIRIEWADVIHSIQGYQSSTLLVAGALAVVSYVLYACYDLLGKHYVGSQLSTRSVMSTAFVAYAFNQSLGALVGTVGLRFRLYSRLGLSALQISKIIALSVITNWLGYITIAGMVFVSGLLSLPAAWGVGTGPLRLLGVAMLCVSGGYLSLCAMRKRREVTFKQQRLKIPSLGLASLQLLLSLLHWPMAAAIIYLLLNGPLEGHGDARIEFIMILGALLLSAIAVVLTHIPAGIGVLEAIFVALLGHRIPIAELLAALLVFRAVYYLGPLILATAVYFGTESSIRNPVPR